MATCRYCGVYGPDDPETGHGSDVCPRCAADGRDEYDVASPQADGTPETTWPVKGGQTDD